MELNCGDYVVLLDEEDLHIYLSRKWVRSKIGGQGGGFYLKNQKDRIHRIIMGATANDGCIIDHINGNGLDNRKSNLRKVTHAENMRNQVPRPCKLRNGKPVSSRYKGVWKNKNRYKAGITLDGRTNHLGSFIKEEDAAKAYNEAAGKYFGAFAVLNTIE